MLTHDDRSGVNSATELTRHPKGVFPKMHPNPDGPTTGRPSTYATRGMVTTPHSLASSAGIRALHDGGSAVDAAIAANAVLCVAYPHMAGLGGDAFLLIYDPGRGRVEALNASGPAAAAATRDEYRSLGHTDFIPTRGPHAVLTVPGAVDGWRAAHERYGRLPWARLFEDAIVYARDGVPVSRSLDDWLVRDEPILRQYARTANVYLPGGTVLRQGSLLRQPDLARSFEVLAELGARDAFYDGPIAAEIGEAMADLGSPLRRDDFANYRAEWTTPLQTTYRGYTAYNFPPNTQGFAALSILNLLEGFDVAAWGDNTVAYYHHMVEAVKVAFADRDAWLTDPAWVDIPLDDLLSKEYAHRRRGLIAADRALVGQEVEPGFPFTPDRMRNVALSGDTVYFATADQDGQVVSIIQSIYHDFGSAVVGGDTGIILQNRGSFFSLADDHPNRLEPGKRTFHTIIPAMLLRDGAPYLAYGSMGGEGQPQTQAALVTRIVDFGYGVQQAIEAPRWLMGRTWGTESRDLAIEARIPDSVISELVRLGHPVKIARAWDEGMGHAQAIRLDRDHGLLEGGADPRGDGAAIGY